VLANGEVIDTARRAKKTAAGYDLTRLMVGSEGTLGVITQLTLKLSGIPEAISGGICPFPSVEACCNTAIHTIQSGIPVARIELLDALQVRAVNLHSKLGLAETPMLFLEFHGTEASVAEQSQRFGEIAAEFGGGPFTWTTRPEERTKLWEARHHAALSNFALRPGAAMVPTDVCVPISRLNASPRRNAILRKAASLRRSSATSATVIFISRSLSTWTMPMRSSAPRLFRNGWLNARLRWTGPAPESMGSDKGK
jgi:D-lactate dehydrogenase (cytochrome)